MRKTSTLSKSMYRRRRLAFQLYWRSRMKHGRKTRYSDHQHNNIMTLPDGVLSVAGGFASSIIPSTLFENPKSTLPKTHRLTTRMRFIHTCTTKQSCNIRLDCVTSSFQILLSHMNLPHILSRCIRTIIPG